ncbi:MAG TPA: serine hydrolase [Acidimicrobiales bacterium]|nr:serine hydrolase [Acidimicrobiales bacterium]
MAAQCGTRGPTETGLDRGLAQGGRETFLDVVRAVAIARVVAWHAFGLAAITYVVAAMPAMFFVTGSLLAKSLGRRDARTVLADRFRRLLVPLWAFGVVAWLAMALAAWHEGTDLPLHRALTWVFPLTDPLGTEWEGGWLTSHLWYLRTVTWLLLFSPLLLRAVRARRRLTFAVALAAVFALDLLARADTALPLDHRTAWVAGDLALYAVFLLAGFLHRDGAFRKMTPRGWVAVAVLGAVAAAAWRLTQPVPLGVVNNSHPLHLFVGAAWLAAALAAEKPLSRLGSSRLGRAPVRVVGSRALTIYLWHTTAIIVAVNALDARGVDGPLAHPVGLVVLTALGTAVAVAMFGWVEDVAARRRPVPAPRRTSALLRPALALATILVVGGAVVVPGDERTGSGGAETAAAAASRAARRPPVPSRPPPAPTFESTAAPGSEPAPTEVLTPQEEDRFVAGLGGVVDRWAEDTGIAGALVGVAGPNARWSGAIGSRPETGIPVLAGDRIELASLTKLFTAALVHRYAEAGLVDLSAPLPELAVLPDFPYDAGITVEQLLDHSSGLVNYLDTDEYAADPDSVHDPVSGVRASLAQGLAADPGAAYLYSSTNYLVLGLLLEEVTGRPYGELLADVFFRPLRLHDTIHRAPEPAWPRGGTAGIETSMIDLLTAGTAILRDHEGLSGAAYRHMTRVDPASGFGPGTFGFCPCRLDSDGVPRFFAIGYYGATTLLAYAPSLDLTIAVDLVDSLGTNGGYDAVSALFERIEELARSS